MNIVISKDKFMKLLPYFENEQTCNEAYEKLVYYCSFEYAVEELIHKQNNEKE